MALNVTPILKFGPAILLSLFAVTILLGSETHADNGALAYARPVDSITIDGDLSDWPADAQTFNVQEHLAGDSWRDPARFRVGYDAANRALYVAMEVEDANVVEDQDDAGNWRNQDAHLLYVDQTHSRNGSGPWIYLGAAGQLTSLNDSDGWDPVMAMAGSDNAELAISQTDARIVYEWRITLDRPIHAGMSLGLDHMLIDHDDGEDAPSPSYVLWGQFGGKSQRSARLGDVVLLDRHSQLGQLSGRIAREEGLEADPIGGRRVQISSEDLPDLWVVVSTNSDGIYQIALPAGRYCVRPAFPLYGREAEHRIAPGVEVCTDVEAASASLAPLLVWRTTPAPNVWAETSGLLFEFGPQNAARFDAFMDAYLDHYVVPGAAVAIIRDGEIAYQQEYGVGNWLTGEPVTRDTLFDVGSITKPVFAFGVLRLAEQGIIDLDRPLSEYLPFAEIENDERYRLITARHVLAHQSGLPNWAFSNPDGQLDIAFTPGQGYRYSGEGFDYLGRVITHLTGEALEDVLLRESISPLGLSGAARFTQRGDWQDVFAIGHSLRRPYASQAPEEAHAAYSLHASAGDLAEMMITMMQRRGLSEAGYEMMLTQEVATGHTPLGLDWPISQGLGIRVTDTPWGLMVGHSGENWGNLSLFEFYDDQNAGFVVLTNGEEGSHVFNAVRHYLVSGPPGE